VEETAERILRDQSMLENNRSTWDSHWTEIAERALPRYDDFNKKERTEGQKRTEKIFDSTAVLALDRAASAIDSLLTPSTGQWHGLVPEDDDLLEDQEVMLFLHQLTRRLFRMRYRPKANFASQAHECYVTLMAFGTLGMFVDDELGIGTRYKSCPTSELYIAENASGMIDLVHRKFPFSARAAMQKWGNKCPEFIKVASEKEPFKKFDFIHCVKPNMEMVASAKDYRGMQFSSYYMPVEGKEVINRSGYRTMPYSISRHVTAPRETYGRSPAMMVLADIKMLNEMEKTTIRAAHKIVDPPLLVHGDGSLGAYNMRPGAINYGGVDDKGNQMVVAMKMGSNLPIALELSEQKRKAINDAFYVTLFQVLVQNPRMSATEAMLRAQEKGQLLAPTVGRQESEFIGTLVERELSIAAAAGMLEDMPAQLMDAGGGIKISHTSPLSRLRRAEDGVAILRTLESVAPIAQYRPEVMDVFDDEAIVRELAEINNVPPKIMRSADALSAMREQKAQRQEQVDALEGAQTASVAAKNLGQAAQAAGFTQPALIPE